MLTHWWEMKCSRASQGDKRSVLQQVEDIITLSCVSADVSAYANQFMFDLQVNY